eukprot:GILK01007293.1.p1 GENE.GILK01007293.1~~GILK01007293.1.p1  ORF type:complete len:1118 (-),score=251.82 GILK01007293.1:71-3373(-)
MANVQDFESVVQAFLSPNNEIRRAADNYINSCKVEDLNKLSLLLLQLLRTSVHPHIRATCAVLLRNAIGKDQNSWDTLTPEVKDTVKNELLASMQADSDLFVKRKVVNTIAAVGGRLIAENSWGELLRFLMQWFQSSDSLHAEYSLLLFASLAETKAVVAALLPYHSVLKNVFTQSLHNPNIKVRLAALKAVASFLTALEDDVVAEYSPLLPAFLENISTALAAGQEDSAREALQALITLVDDHPKLWKPLLRDVISTLLSIASTVDFDDGTKSLAFEVIMSFCVNGAMMRKLPEFGTAVTSVVIHMIANLEDEDFEEWSTLQSIGDTVETSQSQFGQESLSRLTVLLGSKFVLGCVFALLPGFLSSPEWEKRYAAVLAVSLVIAASDKISDKDEKQLFACMPLVFSLFQEQNPRLLYAAIAVVRSMSNIFAPKFQKTFHKQVLPSLIGCLHPSHVPKVQLHSALAISCFCEPLESNHEQLIMPYVEQMLHPLLQLLQISQNRYIQGQVLATVASVATAIEDSFSRFYSAFMPGIKALLNGPPSKDMRNVRGKAIEVIGIIGGAVGKDLFYNDAVEVMDNLMKLQFSGLQSEDAQTAATLETLSRIAKCLGHSFLPYVPTVVPWVLKLAQQETQWLVQDVDEDDNNEDEAAPKGLHAFTLNMRGIGNRRIAIQTSALEEKVGACEMIKDLVHILGSELNPYLQSIAETIVPLINDETLGRIRELAVETAPFLLKACTSADTMVALTQFMWNHLMQGIQAARNVEATCAVIEGVAACVVELKKAPQALTPADIDTLCALLHTAVSEAIASKDERKNGARDEDFDEEEEEALEEEEEQDDDVLLAVMECLGSLCKTYGPHFLPTFDAKFAPRYAPLMQAERSERERTAALCVFDDVVDNCGEEAVMKYAQTLLSFAVRYCADESADVRQAAAFGVGVCAERSGAIFVPFGQGAVRVLSAMINQEDARDEDNGYATDCAISALAKIALFQASSCGMDGAQMLRQWLSYLPLRDDEAEARRTHRLLVSMMAAQHAVLMEQTGQALAMAFKALAEVMSTDCMDVETKNETNMLIAQVLSSDTVFKAAILQQLTPDQLTSLQSPST